MMADAAVKMSMEVDSMSACGCNTPTSCLDGIVSDLRKWPPLDCNFYEATGSESGRTRRGRNKERMASKAKAAGLKVVAGSID